MTYFPPFCWVDKKVYEVYGKMGSSGYPGKNGGAAGLHAVDGNLNLVFVKNHTGNKFNILKKYKGKQISICNVFVS